MTPLVKKLRNVTLLVVGFLLISAVAFLTVSYLCEYCPESRESILPKSDENPTLLPDTIAIISWNIGYAGLGDNMDFFYDGGVKVRDSRERTEQNLSDIITTLRESDADIMLLQEVDLSSHRTYGIDEVARLQGAFPNYTSSFAYNYKALWVPIPLRSPMGRVSGGVVTLSRVRPIDSERVSYPSSFSLPGRMFNLKRCLLSSRFLNSKGDTVLVGNTHNTAYDTGNMRTEEMTFLRDFIVLNHQDSVSQIIGGDWNQYPPSYIPAISELSNPYFVPQIIDGEIFDGLGEFLFDRHSASLRYLDRPYSGTSVQSLTDFFFITDSVRILSIETLQQDFKSSDHNPVLIRVCL